MNDESWEISREDECYHKRSACVCLRAFRHANEKLVSVSATVTGKLPSGKNTLCVWLVLQTTPVLLPLQSSSLHPYHEAHNLQHYLFDLSPDRPYAQLVPYTLSVYPFLLHLPQRRLTMINCSSWSGSSDVSMRVAFSSRPTTTSPRIQTRIHSPHMPPQLLLACIWRVSNDVAEPWLSATTCQLSLSCEQSASSIVPCFRHYLLDSVSR